MAGVNGNTKEHTLMDIINSRNLPLTVKISQNFTLKDEIVLLGNQAVTILERKRVHLICGQNWKKEKFRLQMINVEKMFVDVVEEYYPNTVDEICEIRNEVKYIYLKDQCQYRQYNLKMFTRCKIREINYKEETIDMIDEINCNSVQLPISILFDRGIFAFIHRKETLTIEELVNKDLKNPVSIHAHYPHDTAFPEGVVRIEGLHIYDTIVTVTEIKPKLKYEIFPLYRGIKVYQLQMLQLPEELSGLREFMCDQFRQHLKEIAFSMHFDIFKVRFYGSLELDGQFICRNIANKRNRRSVLEQNESGDKVLENPKACSSDDFMQEKIIFGFNDLRNPKKDDSKDYEKTISPTPDESTETPHSAPTLTSISHMPDYDLKDSQKPTVNKSHRKRGFSVVLSGICERQKRVINLFRIKKSQVLLVKNPLYGSVDTLQRNYDVENYQTKPLPTRKSAPETLEFLKGASSLHQSQNERDNLLNSHKGPSTNFQTSSSFQVTKPVNEYLQPTELLNANNSKAKNPLYGSVDTLQGNCKMENQRIKPLPVEARKSAPARLELSKQPTFLDTSRNETDDILNSDMSPSTNFDTSFSDQMGNPVNGYLQPIELLNGKNTRSELKNEGGIISPNSPPSIKRDMSSTVFSPCVIEKQSQKSVYISDSRKDLNSKKFNQDLIQLDSTPRTEAESFPLWKPDKCEVSIQKSTYGIHSHKHIYESIIYAQMNKSRKPLLNTDDPLKEREIKSLTEVKMLELSGVIKLLQKLNLSRHKSIFKDHIVTGTLLIDSSEETFIEMGTTKFEARKLYKYIRGWRPKEGFSFSDNNGCLENFSVDNIFIMLQRINLPTLATFCKENLVDGLFLRDLVESGYIPKVLKEEYSINLMDIEFIRLKLIFKNRHI